MTRDVISEGHAIRVRYHRCWQMLMGIVCLSTFIHGGLVYVSNGSMLHHSIIVLNFHDTIRKVTFVLFMLIQRAFGAIGLTTRANESSVDFIGSSSDSLLGFTISLLALRHVHSRDRWILLMFQAWRMMASFAIIDWATLISVLNIADVTIVLILPLKVLIVLLFLWPIALLLVVLRTLLEPLRWLLISPEELLCLHFTHLLVLPLLIE